MKRTALSLAMLLFLTGSTFAFGPPADRGQARQNRCPNPADCPQPGQGQGQMKGKRTGPQDGSGPMHTPGTGGGNGSGARRGGGGHR